MRLTGTSGFGFGASWEYRDSDAEIARRVLTFLEDRRLLWVDLSYELPEECFRSAAATREAITREMQTRGIGSELSGVLNQIRMLLADFMTMSPRSREWQHGFPYGADEFSVRLGELRAAVGERLAWIVSVYRLDVDERLASIIPDSGSWLFETFSDDTNP